MAVFFTKAALLTFGGAYAVLPYVNQARSRRYGWLTAEQMIDGLALGETTPGPLIMVVAFVGFVGAWTKAALGPDALALAGIAGAMRRHVLHVPAVVPVHPRRRAARRDRRAASSRSRRRSPASRRRSSASSSTSRCSSRWHVFTTRGGIDVAAIARRCGRGAGAVPLQHRRDPGHRSRRAGRDRDRARASLVNQPICQRCWHCWQQTTSVRPVSASRESRASITSNLP